MKGEFRFIGEVARLARQGLPGLVTGIGDDCAVMDFGGTLVTFTVDASVQEVHFRMGRTSMFDLGRRALAVTLSDLAAMGSRPRAVLVSAALPRGFSQDEALEIVQGMNILAREFGAEIIGGDTTSSPGPLFLDTVGIGVMDPGCRPLLRSGARAGDLICVTGTLGDSAAGLRLLEQERTELTPGERFLVDRHLRPTPRVREGLLLAADSRAHAMMDLSDGLLGDLGHILQASGLSARLDPVAVPRSEELTAHGDPLLALQGGEDYELLVAVEPAGFEDLAGKLLDETGTKLTRLGEFLELTSGCGPEVLDPEGRSLKSRSWDHFPDQA